MTREEWRDWLHGKRVDIAKLPSSDPRKAELVAVLADIEQIDKEWTEIEEYDPDLAAQVTDEIVRAFSKVDGVGITGDPAAERADRRRRGHSARRGRTGV